MNWLLTVAQWVFGVAAVVGLLLGAVAAIGNFIWLVPATIATWTDGRCGSSLLLVPTFGGFVGAACGHAGGWSEWTTPAALGLVAADFAFALAAFTVTFTHWAWQRWRGDPPKSRLPDGRGS